MNIHGGTNGSAPLYRTDWRTRYLRGEPLRIGTEPQPVCDDYLVEDRYGLKRVVGPVRKDAANPLPMEQPLPWESAVSIPRHIIYDPEERMYKGWYSVLQNAEKLRRGLASGYHYYTLYAESQDGLRWKKPALGLIPLAGHENTNLVLHHPGATCLLEDVWLNPQADDVDHRLAALVKTVPPGETGKAIVLMYSPDGKKWDLAPDPILFRGTWDGSYSLVRNPVLNCWMLFRRPPTPALRRTEGFYAGSVQALRMDEEVRGQWANHKRRIAVCMSEDFQHWTHPRGLALPDEIDVSDIDSVRVFRHGSMLLGFVGLMDNPGLLPKHTQLMFSRDGLQWERLPDRPSFLPNGAPGEWDAGQIAVHALVSEQECTRLYYGGTALPQKETRVPQAGGLGLAFVDHNRWVGQQAGPEGGYLLTRQFMLEGSRLAINACSHVSRPAPGLGGLIQAELLQQPLEHNSASAYPGYAMEDSDPIEISDNPHQFLSWNGSPDLSALQGRPVYIRFFLRSLTLYSFTVHTSL